MKPLKITLIGAGNVAQALGTAWAAKGVNIVQVYSRQYAKALALAQRIEAVEVAIRRTVAHGSASEGVAHFSLTEGLPSVIAPPSGGLGGAITLGNPSEGQKDAIPSRRPQETIEAINQLYDIRPDADVYVIAVKDDAIARVAAILRQELGQKIFVVHTSGATALTVLNQYFTRCGIFYPLQTFTVGKKVDFEKIPLFIQCADNKHQRMLVDLAQKLSPHAPTILQTDEQRLALHVAAVLVNNFSNFLFLMAQTVLQDAALPSSVLLPLFAETVEKLHTLSPELAQTGPAQRGDVETLAQHLAYLDAHAPQYRALYALFSELISGIKS